MNMDLAFEKLCNYWQSTKTEALHPFLDLTLLDTKARSEDLSKLQAEASMHHPAAICVYPEHLHLFNQANLAAVVNFPSGKDSLETTLHTIAYAKNQGASEIDYVFPWELYLQGATEETLAHCQKAVSFAHTQGCLIKVIMESGAFPEFSVLLKAALEVLKTGCDFLKTSTGKIATGATPAAAFALLTAMKESGRACGIKFSGGIRSREQAWSYLNLAELVMGKTPDPAWVRIGASKLL